MPGFLVKCLVQCLAIVVLIPQIVVVSFSLINDLVKNLRVNRDEINEVFH